MSHEVNQELWRDMERPGEKQRLFEKKKKLKLISRKASYFVRERLILQ